LQGARQHELPRATATRRGTTALSTNAGPSQARRRRGTVKWSPRTRGHTAAAQQRAGRHRQRGCRGSAAAWWPRIAGAGESRGPSSTTTAPMRAVSPSCRRFISRGAPCGALSSLWPAGRGSPQSTSKWRLATHSQRSRCKLEKKHVLFSTVAWSNGLLQVGFSGCDSSPNNLAYEACHEERRNSRSKDPCAGAALLTSDALCHFRGPASSVHIISLVAPRQGRYSGARGRHFCDGVRQLLRRPHRSRGSPVSVLDCCEVHGLGDHTDEAGRRVQSRRCRLRRGLEASHQFDRGGTDSTHCGSSSRACLVEIVPVCGAELTDGLCRVWQHLRIARRGCERAHFIVVLASFSHHDMLTRRPSPVQRATQQMAATRPLFHASANSSHVPLPGAEC